MSGGGLRRALATQWSAALASAALALTVRLVVLAQLRDADPMLRTPLLDDDVYLELARTGSGSLAGFMAPLYPWLLRGVGAVLPLGMGTASALNVALGSACAAVVALTARELAQTAAAAWIAGAAYAVLGAFVFQDVIPGQEPAITLSMTGALFCALRLARTHGAAAAAALGACAAVASLGRGPSILALAAIVPALRGLGAGARVRLVAAALAGSCAVIALFAGVQAATGDDFRAVPWSGGPNLWLCNGPESRAGTTFGSTELGGGPKQIAVSALRIARADRGEAATEDEASSYWTRRTWESRDAPGVPGLAAHAGRKALLACSALELGSNHSVLLERSYSAYLSLVPVTTWWIFAGGLAGWWLLRRTVPAVGAAAWILAGQWVALTVFFPLGRYRVPSAAVALVVVAAAAALARTLPRRRLVVALALGAVAAVVAFLPVPHGEDVVTAHLNFAVAHRNLGDPPAAVLAHLDPVLAADPQGAAANELLGRLRMDQRDWVGANAPLEVAVARADAASAGPPRAALARVRLELGDLAGAEEIVARGFDPRNVNVELLATGAVVAHRIGNPKEARRRLAAAWKLGPDVPAVAWAMQQTGVTEAELRR